MKLRVFIDTNIFIYAFEYPESNSAKVINLLNKAEIEAIISEQVVNEVIKYFERYHNLELARYFRRYMLEACILVRRDSVLDIMKEYENQIKDKDLEQLAAVKRLGVKYLLAYDRDFEKFEEYVTPKEFIKIMKMKTAESDY